MSIATKTTYPVSKEKMFVYACVAVAVFEVACYMYFLCFSVMHVVMRTETEHAIGVMHTELSELETKLMLAQHRVSAEVASLSGYVEPAARVFIERGQGDLVLRDQAKP